MSYVLDPLILLKQRLKSKRLPRLILDPLLIFSYTSTLPFMKANYYTWRTRLFTQALKDSWLPRFLVLISAISSLVSVISCCYQHSWLLLTCFFWTSTDSESRNALLLESGVIIKQNNTLSYALSCNGNLQQKLWFHRWHLNGELIQ